MTQIKSVLQRSKSTFIQDFAGAAAISVMLYVALHLPSFA